MWPCGGITKYHQLYTSWKLSRQSQCFVSTGRTVTADNDKEAPGRDLYFPQTEHNIGHCSYQCCDQRGADDRLGWCWSGAAVWCLLMKMLCDEQLGCGARGQPPTLASLHRSPGPWCRMSPLACTGHNTTQSSVVCTADHNTRLLVSGYLQNWAILSRCIQETCCSVMPLTRTMPPP